MDRNVCTATGSVLDATEGGRGKWRVTCGHPGCRWSERVSAVLAEDAEDQLRDHFAADHGLPDVEFFWGDPA